MKGVPFVNRRYMKGVPFVNRRYTKGLPFSWKSGISKGKRLDLLAEPPRMKICWVRPSPPPGGGLLHVFWNFPLVWFIACLFAVFGMLLGDTLILDDLDCANKYRQQVSTLVVNAFKGDVYTGRFAATNFSATRRCKIVAILIQMVQQCSNIAGNTVSRLAVSGC